MSLIACGDDDGGGDDDGNNDPLTGPYTHYVNDTVKVPQDSTQTRDLGLNIDGDENDRPDNALGGILAALKGQGVDIQTTVNESVTSGTLILLHSIQADDLVSDTSVGWKVLLGDATATDPAYDGTDAFTVAAGSPQDGLLRGAISGGQFNGGPGNITIQLSLTEGTPIQVKLIGARLKANVTATGCTDGVLGGAITDEELNTSVIPGIQTLMQASVLDDAETEGGALTVCAVADDPVCKPSAGGDATTCDTVRKICRSSTTKTILDLFDANEDAMITVMEIKDNTLIKALLAPDVDLLNGTTFEPRVDGVKDSLSVGLGFTCKNGVFTVPGE